ncbi:MAG TPA: helix-turn-helix domain-containing protein [Thermoleophilaceae bacterium]|nr:helix-turn-helix domain-containing protein [Thermoleophilaceae bacterium]
MTVQRKREYTKTRRAQLEAETGRRITAATVELHREVGPANTTISAIAERAGVQRLTVYRHFPDERTLLRACSAHWRAGHPAPDPSPWPSIADPVERLRAAVAAFYAYYRSDEAMMAKIRRDAEAMPVLAETIADVRAYMEMVVEILAAGWGVRGRRRELLMAAIGHTIDFHTWRSLERLRGLAPDRAEELAVAMVLGAADR